MKKKIFLTLITLIAAVLPTSVSAEKISYQMCTKISGHLNSTYPMAMNRYVTLVSSYCSGYNGVPSLHYIYHTEFEELQAGENDRKRNAYCTNKDGQVLLRILDAIYVHYSSPSGKEIGVFEIRQGDCR